MRIKRAISILSYNRAENLPIIIENVIKTAPADCDIFVCDDGSTDDTPSVVAKFPVIYVRGDNLGVAINKNRALYLMRDHHFSAMIEDDLYPTSSGWFQIYETVSQYTDIHHFCRIQDKEIPESIPPFTEYLKETLQITPIYASSPRGDFTFLTKKVLQIVGGLNPLFKGVGFAHGEWSNRVAKAGLVSHPLHWVDIKEARDKFSQIGDTVGGRWNLSEEELKKQLRYNGKVDKSLRKNDYIFCPLEIA